MAMEAPKRRKPRVLCLHGFRGSSKILQKLIGRWPESVLLKLDLVFLDGPIPAQGKSDLEPVFDPPFYEWFQANQVHMDLRDSLTAYNISMRHITDQSIYLLFNFWAGFHRVHELGRMRSLSRRLHGKKWSL